MIGGRYDIINMTILGRNAKMIRLKKSWGFLLGIAAILLTLMPMNVFAAITNNGIMNGTGTWGVDIDNTSTGVIIAGNYTATVYNHGLIVGGTFNNIVDEGDGRYGLRVELTNLDTAAITSDTSDETYTYADVEYLVMPYNTEYSFTLTAAEGYDLPGSINILRGDTALVSGTDYTYDKASGTVTIHASAVNYPLTLEAAGVDANAVARIGDTTYESLYAAFVAASGMDEFNGTAVSADNPVVIEVLKDHTLEDEIYVRDDWHVRLTSAEGGPYTVTRDPVAAPDTMIQMYTAVSYPPRDYNSTLILDNIILDGGATEDSSETDSILLIEGTAIMNDGAVIQNNKGRNNGSAVDVQEGSFIMNDGSVIQNNTTAGSGGAVTTWAEFVMNGGTIQNNAALGNYVYGGGVNVSSTDGASFTMNGGTITGNSAARNGGGVYFSNNGTSQNVFLYGGTITGNVSKGVFGDSPEDVYTQNGSVLVMGGNIQIGYTTFGSTSSKIIVSSPLTNSTNLDYDLTPTNGTVVIEKGENYGEGSLDRSKFVFTGWSSRCLWLSEDGSEITVNAHGGGTNTCTEAAVCTNCGAVYGKALGHDWGDPEWTWSEDHSSSSAKFTCQNDASHIETVNAEISSSTTAADCTNGGETVYTANAVFNEKTYTDEKTVDIPALGHDWGDPEWTWSEDHSSASAKFTCQKDASHTETVNAEISSSTTAADCTNDGETAYTAKAVFNEKTYTDVQKVTITATGHTPGTEWKSDGTSHWNECTECGELLNESSHTYEWITDKKATETQAGSRHEECSICSYKKAAVEIPAIGTSGTGQKDGSASPKSGDSDSYALWIVLMILACGGITGTALHSYKRKTK